MRSPPARHRERDARVALRDPQRLELLREERDRITKELASDRSEQEDLNKKLGIAAVAGATPILTMNRSLRFAQNW